MNRPKLPLTGVLMILAVLGCSDTVHAQVTLTVTPSSITNSATPLAFNSVPVGSTSQSQNITVTASISTTVLLQPVNTPWLVFSGGNLYTVGSTGTTIPVAVSASGLSQGSYSGKFYLTVNQQILSTVYVAMDVSGTSALSANPSSLSFTAQQGSSVGTPASTMVTISSSTIPIDYNLQTQTSDTNWILLSAHSGMITGMSGDTFNVSVNPSGLSVGSHTGSITAFSTTTNDSVTISVTLTVNAAVTLTVTPSQPPAILWQTGTTDPAAQQFTLTATGGTLPFNATLSPSVTWAVLSPLSGTVAPGSPVTLTVTPKPNSAVLSAGTYTTNLVVTPEGGSDLPGVPITLVATAHPILQFSPASLAFTAQFSSTQTPADQTVMVTASGGGVVPFTVSSDSSWLTASASSGSTPSTLTVHVNPTSLPVGMLTGNLTLQPTNGDNYTKTIPVTLNVVAASQVSAGPSQLLFSYQTGFLPPSSQTVQLTSSGQPVSFTLASATTSCGNTWLSATSSGNTTPTTLTVSVNTTGLSAGTCTGTVTVNYNSGSGAASTVINVMLAVSDSAVLKVSMPAGFGVETAQLGAASFNRQVSLTSTDFNNQVSYSAALSNVTGGGTWISLAGSTVGFTPQNLTIQISPSGVSSPGIYTANLVISSTSLPSGSVTIPIMLTVTSNVTVSVAPTSLSFNQAQGGPPPSAQTLTLTTAGGNTVPTFTATIPQITGGNWLKVSPTSGSATGSLQVSILSNTLSQGNYPAQILLTFQNSATASITVNVTLHVGPAQTVSVSPQSLSFSYQMGGSQPGSQKLSVTSTGGAVNFMIGVTSSGWLSADVTSGTTPKDVNVSVNTQGLTASGSPYNGSISISAPGVLANPIVVNVTLTVTGVPTPIPTTVSSNASGAFGAIAPGELITIKGSLLGPASPPEGTLFTVNSSGGVDPILAGVRVLFSNNPGTPIYVSATQINVIVPYEIAGRTSTNIVVENQGVQSAPIPVAVADAAPGLYTNNFTGSGQVAALNQNGTYNGPPGGGFSPAPQGSVLVVYATGFGQTNPPGTTGSVTPVPPAGPLQNVPGQVTATIGGQTADVEFAGAAPGLVTGVTQLNIKVPTGVSGNALAISVTVNGKSTPLVGTTVAVQ